MLNLSLRSYVYEFYEKHFPGLLGSGFKNSSELQCSHKTEFLSLPAFHTILLPETENGECKMFMLFYYYRNSKCLGRAVSGAEKRFKPCFNRILRLLSFQFMVAWVTLLWAIYGSPGVLSRHLKSLELSDLGFELLMQISWLHIECAAS